jgi:hypothetical protein
MIVELPALIVPPGVEMRVDVGYDNDREDFFINNVELGKSELEVTKLEIINPRGLPIDILPIGPRNEKTFKLRIAGTFLTKGSRVILTVKNPTTNDIKIKGFLGGHGIPTNLPFDPATKARLYRAFCEHIASAKNILHYLKESIF